MTGHPDDQSYANTTSGNLFPAATQTLPPGVTSSPIIPVAQWLSLSLIVTPSAGTAKVTVAHFADSLGATLLGSDTWGVSNVNTLVVRTPLRGAFVQVQVNVTSAGSLTATTWMFFQSAAADRITFPVGFQAVNAFNRTLAASGVDNYFLLRTCAGLANWHFFPHDTTAKLQVAIQATDETGAFLFNISNRGTPAGLDNALLEIPDSVVRVAVTNQDGAASHTYDFSLTVPPQ